MADVMKQILMAPAAILTVVLLLALTTSTAALAPLKASAAANQTNTNASDNASINSNTTNTSQQSGQAKINVVASFYPTYEFVKAVGDDRINLSVLIPFGSEPHNFDPTIQQVQKANSANLLVYNGASMEEPWIHNLTPQTEHR
jgi:zinc transport system substrate-binding protein